MYKAIYASAWDLVDDGRDAALERIRESGFNTITLGVSQPGRSATATQATGPPQGARMDALAELQRAPDLDRAAWVELPRRAVGRPHDDYVARNAFGEPYPHRLCPAHPRARLRGILCSDLAHGYDLAAVVLEARAGCPATGATIRVRRGAARSLGEDAAFLVLRGHHASRRQGGWHRRRPAAGKARQLLESYRDAPIAPADMTAAWWFGDVVSDPEWAAFLDWRCRQVADLVTEAKAALPAGTALTVIPTVPCGGMAARIEGSDIGMLAAAADALEIPLHQASAEEAYQDAGDIRRRAGDDAALRFILRPRHSDTGNGTETREAVLKLKQIGIAGIALYDYDHIRRAGPAQIKAALDALESA